MIGNSKRNVILFAVAILLLSPILLENNFIGRFIRNRVSKEKILKQGKIMSNRADFDYTAFDRPEISAFLFHPRKDTSPPPSGKVVDINIPVDENVNIGARFFTADEGSPTILFFHGNGEIVADYNDLGPVYVKMGINFLPVDYRGYGHSTGKPTVSTMMNDSHIIFKYIKDWLKENNYSGRLIILGRSLGSASALEIAANYSGQIDALIIESGFAYALPLLKLLGINTDLLGIKEDEGFRNIDKIKRFNKPTLIIHSEFDHIIPYSDGQALFESSPAEQKKMLKIEGANHNSIFLYGMNEYLKAVKELTEDIK